MRVTTNMMVNNITANLFRQSERLLDAQTKVSTGKQINRPSDDPIGLGNILQYRSTLSSIDQYSTNVSMGQSWIETSETTLDSIQSLLDQVTEIAVEQSSGELDNRETSLEIMTNLYDQILDLANTQSADGRYFFGGTQTDIAPFSRDDDYNAVYNSDSGEIRIITGENSSQSINVTGEELFIDGVNVFDVMGDLISALEDPDASANTDQIAALIEPLNQAVEQIQNKTVEIAATYETLELTQNRLSDLEYNVENMLYDEENADMNQAIIELQVLETAYETTLEVASMITSQASLMDFL